MKSQGHRAQSPGDTPWHAQPVAEALRALDTTAAGLTAAEAERRLAQYGPNLLPEGAPRPAWLRLLQQFHNMVNYVLFAAAIVTGAMGHWIDTAVITAVVVINALIGFFQEGKAERSLDAIKKMLTHDCLVERDGRRQTIPAEQVVPGDVVFIQSGDRVPADVRLLSCRNLRNAEASLTGESVPVSKSADPAAAEAALGDRASMAYSGTYVATGQGTGVAVATGAASELGRIGQMLANVVNLKTPLLIQVDRFGRIVSIVVVVLALLAFLLGWLVRDYAVGEMFLIAVSLAVAAIPEGLPAILSITLAIGVQRMAARKAIIRRLHAVDTLGAVDVICSDKTGTLTRNEMMVADVVLPDGANPAAPVQVDGEGYTPTGTFRRSDASIEPGDIPGLLDLARCGSRCSDARLEQDDQHWTPVGDPIEAALLTLAMKAGLDPKADVEQHPRADVIPFESEHRFMATLHRDHAGGGEAAIKGAPEVILARCVGIDVAAWTTAIEDLARRGRRVLALARRRFAELPNELTFSLVEGDLELLGLIGAIDPPRSDAIAAIAECHEAGIRVVMITGDHAITAGAIAHELGLRAETVLTGVDIDADDDEALKAAVMNCDVYARVSPEHKLRIVTAMQAHGRTIAMTGDGVNDAPALKRAHIGIAMGLKGTEVAKEAADMVLIDDAFASIAAAVREGRTVYDNLRKAILFILPTSGGEALVILAALVLGFALPLSPVQILWVNLVTAVTLALALAFEPGERDLMQRPPRPMRSSLLPPLFLWRIVEVSVLMAAGTFGVFMWLRSAEASLAEAQTAAVNMLVVLETIYLFNARSITGPVLGARRPPKNGWVWIAAASVLSLQIGYTYLPWSQQLFKTAPIDALTWGVIAVTAVAMFVWIETEKALVRRWMRRRQ